MNRAPSCVKRTFSTAGTLLNGRPSKANMPALISSIFAAALPSNNCSTLEAAGSSFPQQRRSAAHKSSGGQFSWDTSGNERTSRCKDERVTEAHLAASGGFAGLLCSAVMTLLQLLSLDEDIT